MCPGCDGSGVVSRTRDIDVEIPPGVRDGHTLRVPFAEGQHGVDHEEVLVEVSVRAHPRIDRDGDDLHVNVPITFPTAALGGTVDVSLFVEERALEIPPSTESGRTFELEDAGMPSRETDDRGDLYVTTPIVIPSDLTETERTALKTYTRCRGTDV